MPPLIGDERRCAATGYRQTLLVSPARVRTRPSLSPGPARFPDPQLELEHFEPRGRPAAGHAVDQEFESTFRHLLGRLAQGRHGGSDQAGPRRVIDSHHRHIVRHPPRGAAHGLLEWTRLYGSRSISPVKEITASDDWLNYGGEEHRVDNELILAQLEYTVAPPTNFGDGSAVENIWDAQFDLVIVGQQDVDTAIDATIDLVASELG